MIKYFALPILFILLINNQLQAQNDTAVLQNDLDINEIDSSLLMPQKMLFTQSILWGSHGLLKNKLGNLSLIHI